MDVLVLVTLVPQKPLSIELGTALFCIAVAIPIEAALYINAALEDTYPRLPAHPKGRTYVRLVYAGVAVGMGFSGASLVACFWHLSWLAACIFMVMLPTALLFLQFASRMHEKAVKSGTSTPGDS